MRGYVRTVRCGQNRKGAPQSDLCLRYLGVLPLERTGVCCPFRGSIQTVRADAAETGIHSLDPAVKALFCLRKQVFQTIERKICYAAAAGTDKMTVSGSVRVKVIDAVAYMEPQDLASVRQQRQVAVNGTQTDVRIFLPDILIDNVGGRVIFARH